MSTTIDTVPEKLTDAEARALLDKVAPRAKKISDEIVRTNARAEQGQQQLAQLQERAMQNFQTHDPAEIKAILDKRMAANAEKVRTYLSNVTAAEEQSEAVKKSAPTIR